MSDPEQADGGRSAVVRGVPTRIAIAIAVLIGALAGGAVLLFAPGAPWWMAPFIFLVVGVVALRILRPLPRTISWADEA